MLLHIQKVLTKNRKTTVILYFDGITAKKICPEIIAIRGQKVDHVKRSTVKIYKEYESGMTES